LPLDIPETLAVPQRDARAVINPCSASLGPLTERTGQPAETRKIAGAGGRLQLNLKFDVEIEMG
jgi:hypothetical protein